MVDSIDLVILMFWLMADCEKFVDFPTLMPHRAYTQESVFTHSRTLTFHLLSCIVRLMTCQKTTCHETYYTGGGTLYGHARPGAVF